MEEEMPPTVAAIINVMIDTKRNDQTMVIFIFLRVPLPPSLPKQMANGSPVFESFNHQVIIGVTSQVGIKEMIRITNQAGSHLCQVHLTFDASIVTE